MEKCISCGREFEPLPLPELPEFLGIKAPHRVICPPCAIHAAAAAASLAVAVLKELEKAGKAQQS